MPEKTLPASISVEIGDRDMLLPKQKSGLETLVSSQSSTSIEYGKLKKTGSTLSRFSSLACSKKTPPSSECGDDGLFNPRQVWNYPPVTTRSMVKRRDGAYRNPDCDELVSYPPARTDLFQCLEWLCSHSGYDVDCIGQRAMKKDGTYGQLEFGSRGDFLDDVLRHAEGFRQSLDTLCPVDCYPDMASYPSSQDEQRHKMRFIGVAMRNRYEYSLIEFVAQVLGIVLVPIYTTFGAEAMTAMVEETRMKTLLVDLPTLKTLLGYWESEDPAKSGSKVTNVILSHGPKEGHDWVCGDGDQLRARLQKLGVSVTCIPEYRADTKMDLEYKYEWNPEEIWTISYTSGTTGRPKGVMLTQRALMMIVHDLITTYVRDDGLAGAVKAPYQHTYFSYLPLAHILERTCLNGLMVGGCRMAFFSGILPNLVDEVKAAKTTVLVTVPRILERIHMKVMDAMKQKSYLVKFLFNRALAGKIAHNKATGQVSHPLWDSMIMNKVKGQVVGSQLKSIICGGAPLSTEIRSDIQAILGAQVLIGYGLTESCGATFVQHSTDTGNTIGWVMNSAECMLDDLEDLGYKAKDGKGELLLRGYSLFSGYFRQPDQTDAVFTEDGWFRTGDVAQITDKDGAAIIDRAKNCFKLAQGEYIAPEKIENVLKVAPSVDQVIVTGSSTETKCVAVVSLSEGFVEASGKSGDELARDPEIQKQCVAEMTQKAKEANLLGFEIPAYFVFIGRSLLPDDGFHTPTLKIKRPIFQKKYVGLIAHLYKEKKSVALDINQFLATEGPDFQSSLL